MTGSASQLWSQSAALRVAMVAGEASGDRLGAGLMAALAAQRDCAFVGVGGSRMLAQGLRPLFEMERLTVNGLVDPLRRLPDLLARLRQLERTLTREPPDVFVGVDFNVFNLLLERRLKRRGIKVVHYVSPSVYAWRRGRVRRVARSADLLLTLFPFEAQLYQAQPLQVEYVGHPLADEIAPDAGAPAARQEARETLQRGVDANVAASGTWIALLPGSRTSEVRFMGATFLAAAQILARELGQRAPVFVVPCATPRIRDLVQARLAEAGDLPVVLYDGDARLALTACDVALVKSGTSTLEAMLLQRPMVVSYKLGEVSYRVINWLLRTRFIALPNILAGRELVPELLQHDATPAALAKKIVELLDNDQPAPEYLATFAELHQQLRRRADQSAARAVLNFVDADASRA